MPDLGAMVRGQNDLALALSAALLAIDLAEKAGADAGAVERLREIVQKIISGSSTGT